MIYVYVLNHANFPGLKVELPAPTQGIAEERLQRAGLGWALGWALKHVETRDDADV